MNNILANYFSFKEQIENEPFNIFRQYNNEDNSITYSAGYPHYPRNFSRDTIVAGIIASNSNLLASQLDMSTRHQGQKEDPITGEKPGKIHHEYPGVSVNGRNLVSTYNACDTTALFLIAVEGLELLDQHKSTQFKTDKLDNLKRAVDHLVESIDSNYLLWETPPKNSNKYALKVTYWKDSILPNTTGKTEPIYPVVYPQAQFIAARGLLGASKVLQDHSLATIADTMYRNGIQRFIRDDGYVVYLDQSDELLQISSDELHSLAYIPKIYKQLLPIKAISDRAKKISTPFGYMCTPLAIAETLTDKYHGNSVWIFEQALIHYGATKFGLKAEATIAALVTNHIGEGQELLSVDYDNRGQAVSTPKGNDRQLWSQAAREYFTGHSYLLANNWL